MANPIARWREEHLRFAKLLDTLEAQLDRFHRAEHPDYALMLEVMRYMRGYPDKQHHPREDIAFAKVGDRDSRAEAIARELVAEHSVIEESGDSLVTLLEGCLDEAILTRESVEKPGRDYIRRLRAHMQSEETLFPYVARHLRETDWEDIDRAIPPIPDPLIEPRGHEQFRSLQRLVSSSKSNVRRLFA